MLENQRKEIEMIGSEVEEVKKINTFTWTGRIERSRSFPDVDEKDDSGEILGTKKIMVNRVTVILSHEKYGEILFRVSIRNNRVSFIDTREETTGSTVSTFGTKSIKGGKRQTLTSPAWINEVARYIGDERASEIVDEILFP